MDSIGQNHSRRIIRRICSPPRCMWATMSLWPELLFWQFLEGDEGAGAVDEAFVAGGRRVATDGRRGGIA